MKLKDLRIPFSWEERRPYYDNLFFYIPAFYDAHDRSALPKDAFENDNPVYIEYCSGNGEWLIEQAKSHPNVNWVGVEMKFKRARQLHVKARNNELKNLLTVCGEALTFTRHYLAEGSVDAFFVNFPDPWPKDRHAKNRLLTPEFAGALKRAMKKGGKGTLVTDDLPYFEQMCASFDGWKVLEPDVTPEMYGESFFKRLWESLERKINIRQLECAK